ncbi:MAG: alanine--tRNA ligase [Solirubrobacterales bacterium]|nr:alanine--tRNA ligase [Solirubrobacterales bacterium]
MATTDEIRSTFIDHFEREGHLLLGSAPLVPATHDASVLLTTAGMHPLKPYFLGQDTPPNSVLTSCQKCFRTTDIENVGSTARHLTFFEMLGNFSIGGYFKEGAIAHAWKVATEGFGFAPDQIWITVFAGDPELGLGPDQEAIDAWVAVGVDPARITQLGRKDNFWQAGPTGPCGPCSELYFDRGPEFGPDSERPGDDGERHLEFWNLVFMEYEQSEKGELTPLPSKNIDTGMGLNRMAAILQGVGSVFDTDQFVPLMALGRELATDEVSERSLRILADHSRAMCFLIADGVVPSNEERGYILRRLMRRAILHGRKLGMETGFLVTYAEAVEKIMAENYPELIEQRDVIRTWVAAEEEGFGRTLVAGSESLDELIAAARTAGLEGISAADAFLLHDTHGFPIDLTLELVAEHGLGVDEAGFELLMDEQRERARGGSATATPNGEVSALDLAATQLANVGSPANFVGYSDIEVATTVTATEPIEDGAFLLKLAESPFYAAGGGQVGDVGLVITDNGQNGDVASVLRVGADQVILVTGLTAAPAAGSAVTAVVDRGKRFATQANHTATHLLHAALRERLGSHVRQAGSYVGPDKLRFDFTHGEGLTPADIGAIEDQVNAQILANDNVSSSQTTLDAAKAKGAMALFGEKYGDVVRLVEIGDGGFSRELCGGTHVRSTAEIGCFKITSEGSSAANVRRVEAVTGPVAIDLLRVHDQTLSEIASQLKTTPDAAASSVRKRLERLKELEKVAESGAALDPAGIAGEAIEVGGLMCVFAEVSDVGGKALPDLADRVLGLLGEGSVVVLAARGVDKVDLVAAVGPGAIAQGVKAGEIVAKAAAAVGGGGGGKDSMARAGGKDPELTPDALLAARNVVEAATR